jgi:Na+-driven multidrug efflux pump
VDVAVQDEIVSIWNICKVFLCFDTIKVVAAACIQASSRQALGVAITGINYFVIGVPVSIYLV